MAKFGIALGSGPRGLGFESRHSDQRSRIRFCGFWIFLRLPREPEASCITIIWPKADGTKCPAASGSNPDTPITKTACPAVFIHYLTLISSRLPLRTCTIAVFPGKTSLLTP